MSAETVRQSSTYIILYKTIAKRKEIREERYSLGTISHCIKLTVLIDMMTSSDGNIFRVTGHLCGKFTGPRLIPLTKASDVEL